MLLTDARRQVGTWKGKGICLPPPPTDNLPLPVLWKNPRAQNRQCSTDVSIQHHLCRARYVLTTGEPSQQCGLPLAMCVWLVPINSVPPNSPLTFLGSKERLGSPPGRSPALDLLWVGRLTARFSVTSVLGRKSLSLHLGCRTHSPLWSPPGEQLGPDRVSPPLLLGSVRANYLLSRLQNQAFAGAFLMGPRVKLGFGVH